MGSCFGCLMVNAGNLQKWGSNHLALACELAFLSGILNFNTNNPGRGEQSINAAFSGTLLSEMMMCILLLHLENSSTTLLNVPFF
jgi:hypothetical protein